MWDSYACERVLDPSIYPPELVWSPEPAIADADCPASGPSYLLELPPPVLVSGPVTLDGGLLPPDSAVVRFKGRSGEGEAEGVVVDGSFAAELLPGRYDVSLSLSPDLVQLVAEMPVATDLEIVADMVMPIDIPIVTVSGAITMDGQPAQDPRGFLHVGGNGLGIYMQMSAGSYAFQATPGTYVVRYDYCEFFMCHDLIIPLETPRVGPQQESAPIVQIEVGTTDMQIDVDVPTANISGTVTIDGAPASGSIVFSLSDEIELSDDGSFDQRWVALDYERVHLDLGWSKAWDGWLGEPLPELQMLEEDLHVEIHRQSAAVSAAWPGSMFAGWPELRLWYPEALGVFDHTVIWPEMRESVQFFMWPGVRSAAVVGTVCWPDLEPEEGLAWQRIGVMLEDAVEFSGVVDLDANVEAELAAVHIDLLEDMEWVSADGLLTVVPLNGPPPSIWEPYPFPAWDDRIDAHGYLPRGPATVSISGDPVGVVNIEDGTTLVLRPVSSPIEARVEFGGVVPYANSLRAVDADAPSDHDPPLGNIRPPGRYLLRYVSQPEGSPIGDGLPDNRDATIGCITLEG